MNESTKTKKALRGSLLALFLCIVLLIGTTFAWFTDTASTGVNKIQAGNLKVGLEYKDANGKWQDATLEVKRSANAEKRPNQEYYVELMDGMSFSRFICPENKEEVLDALQSAFRT